MKQGAPSLWRRQQAAKGGRSDLESLLMYLPALPRTTEEGTSTSEERSGRKESDLVPWRKSKSEARHRQSEKARGTEARQSTADLTGGGGTAARRGISRDAPGVYRRRESNRIQDRSEFRSRGHGMPLSRDKVSPSWPQNHAFFFLLEPELLGAGPPLLKESTEVGDILPRTCRCV